MQIVEYIPNGKENAIHLQELVSLLGLSESEVKAAIRRARKDGAIILSGICGYWISDNEYEINEFIKLMQGQAQTRIESANAIINNVTS